MAERRVPGVQEVANDALLSLLAILGTASPKGEFACDFYTFLYTRETSFSVRHRRENTSRAIQGEFTLFRFAVVIIIRIVSIA